MAPDRCMPTSAMARLSRHEAADDKMHGVCDSDVGPSIDGVGHKADVLTETRLSPPTPHAAPEAPCDSTRTQTGATSPPGTASATRAHSVRHVLTLIVVDNMQSIDSSGRTRSPPRTKPHPNPGTCAGFAVDPRLPDPLGGCRALPEEGRLFLAAGRWQLRHR